MLDPSFSLIFPVSLLLMWLAKPCNFFTQSDLQSFRRDLGIVIEELVSPVVAPVGGHLAQQHVILVMLA